MFFEKILAAKRKAYILYSEICSFRFGESNLRKLQDFYNGKKDWVARAHIIRNGIVKATNIDPKKKRPILYSKIESPRLYNGYKVENVSFAVREGYIVTGNLYRPLKKREGNLHPIILVPHGHFENGRFDPEVQNVCATLARMGAIVMTYDMVGFGESFLMNGTNHNYSSVLAHQLHNSLCVVDFLVSIEGANPDQIGVTGASGGGTQAIFLAAIDDRIKVSIPVVMVSSRFFGGCNCEVGMSIHRRREYSTNNAEIAAMIAPKPLLLISSGGDWTKHVPSREFPFIQRIYNFYKMKDRCENAHFPRGGHDYCYEKRVKTYSFFSQYFDLEINQVMNSDGTIDEIENEIESREIMSWTSIN